MLYLLPLGHFPETTSPPLEEIRSYAAAFFQLEVRILPAYLPTEQQFEPRVNRRTGRRQVLATSVLEFLKTRLPADAYCLLGVTMEDLYPAPSWNYVFGQASLGERVGVYSFVRYDPAFWDEERGTDYRDIILRRSCQVLAHETGHMFGLQHCIFYDCVLNGSNHLVEADSHPPQLCPVCLRKLHYAGNFDAVKRYEQLREFYHKHRWFQDADWVARQLAKLQSPEAFDFGKTAPVGAVALNRLGPFGEGPLGATAPTNKPTPGNGTGSCMRSANRCRAAEMVRDIAGWLAILAKPSPGPGWLNIAAIRRRTKGAG